MTAMSLIKVKRARGTVFRVIKNAVGFMTGFTAFYIGSYAVLTIAGVPAGTAPLVAGAFTAVGLQVIARRRRPASFPHRAHLKTLDRFSQELLEMANSNDLGELVVETLGRALELDRIYLWLPSRAQRNFELAAGFGASLDTTVLPETWLLDYFLPRNVDADGHELPSAMDHWLLHRRMTSGTPIYSHGQLVGLLTYGRKRNGNGLDESDAWLMGQVGRQAALALSYVGLRSVESKRRSKLDNLTHLYNQAQMRAVNDGLTGLNTHLFFKDQMTKRFSEARRHHEPLSVALIDVDNFRKLNQTFGQAAGDEVLRKVANAVKQAARTDDTVARYGGEELALVLPHTDLVGAQILGERIREAVAALQFDFSSDSPNVTVSVGLAQMESADEDQDAMIERADRALYAAKRKGRNQVCVTG